MQGVCKLFLKAAFQRLVHIFKDSLPNLQANFGSKRSNAFMKLDFLCRFSIDFSEQISV